MKTYKVGVCDSDLDYATALMDYVNHSKTTINMVAFSRMNAVKDYLTAQDLDIIITDDIRDCSEHEGELRFCDIRTLQFSEYKGISDGWQEMSAEESYIYKYQPASGIMNFILKELDVRRNNTRQVAEVIGVYSPLGRCGTTRLAKALTSFDEVRGGLYIGMENFSSSIDRMSTDILYLLKTHSSDLEEAINRSIKTEGDIHTLGLAGTYLDANNVSFSEIKMLKDMLLKTGRFTTIVFDIGSAALTDLSVFNCFERIFMPALSDDISRNKIEVFLKLMKDTGNRAVISRIIPVSVPDAEVGSTEMTKCIWQLMDRE